MAWEKTRDDKYRKVWVNPMTHKVISMEDNYSSGLWWVASGKMNGYAKTEGHELTKTKAMALVTRLKKR
jgi:hypothetical protein